MEDLKKLSEQLNRIEEQQDEILKILNDLDLEQFKKDALLLLKQIHKDTRRD